MRNFTEDVNTHAVKRFVVGDNADGRERWYGLGTNLVTQLGHAPKSVQEAMEAANLDWAVSMEPSYQLWNGEYREIPNKLSAVRDTDGLVLGTGFSKIYRAFGNAESFDFVNALLDTDMADLLTAGSLDDGRKTFIQATLKNSDVSYIGGEKKEAIDWYCTFLNSFDGSKAITALITPVRLWCLNQTSFAIKNAAHRISIRHTTKATEKIAEAQRVLGLASNYRTAFEDIANRLVSIEMDAESFSSFVEELEVGPRLENLYQENWNGSVTSGVRPTAWRGLQVITEADQWLRGGRGDMESRFESALDGQTARRRDRAVQLLINR